jgi:cytochrome c-type biogenesis protein
VLYSIGLGLPFIALALVFNQARGSLAWLRRHGRGIEVLGGVLMVAVGLLFVTGRWQELFLPLQRVFARLEWPPI